MTLRVESVMHNLVCNFEFPNKELLKTGDIGEVAKLWKDRGLLLEVAASEMIFQDDLVREEALDTINDFKAVALEVTPCLRALMRETASGIVTKNHEQMIKCAVGSYEKMVDLIEEACDYVSPSLLTIYQARRN